MRKLLLLLLVLRAGVSEGELAEIESGQVKVDFHRQWGGAIAHIIYLPTNDTLVDDHDDGRLIQVAFYDGRDPWVWDPVEGGCLYDTGAVLVLDSFFTSASGIENGGYYAKTIPRDWKTCALLPDTIQKWVEFVQDTVIKAVWTAVNTEYDTFFHFANQEFPCHYGLPKFKYFAHYGALSPWTYDPCNIDTFPTNDFSDTIHIPEHILSEHWIAQVETTDFALTMFSISGMDHGSAQKFVIDVHPTYTVLIDKFQYAPGYRPVSSVYLIVGDYNAARDWIYDKRSEILAGKNFEFDSDDNWTAEGDIDAMFPDAGALHIIPAGSHPTILSPGDLAIDTKNFKSLQIRLRTTAEGTLWVCFQNEIRREFSPDMCAYVLLSGEDIWETYTLDMTDKPFWDGFIYRLRITFPGGADEIAVDYVKTVQTSTLGWDFCGYTDFRPAQDIDTVAYFPDSGFVRFRPSGDTSQILLGTDPGWRFEDLDTVKIRLRSDRAGQLHLYWMKIEFPVFWHNFTIDIPGDGEWHTFAYSTAESSDWSGTVWSFRVDLIDLSGATVDLDFVHFIKDTTSTGIAGRGENFPAVRVSYAGNTLYLSGAGKYQGTAYIYDIAGRCVFKSRFEGNEIHLAGALPQGVYFLIVDGATLMKAKFVVVR